jgi:hypothetical protein
VQTSSMPSIKLIGSELTFHEACLYAFLTADNKSGSTVTEKRACELREAIRREGWSLRMVELAIERVKGKEVCKEGMVRLIAEKRAKMGVAEEM